MPARIIDGSAHARAIRAELALQVSRLPQSTRRPGITVIQVGDDPGSTIYVRNKHRAAEEAGFQSAIEHLDADIAQQELHHLIDRLAARRDIDGILLQLPLPHRLDPEAALERIPPHKDVDGLHPYNAGRLAQGEPTFVPATPLGVSELLRREGIDPKGKHAVIVGRSRLVGRPLALLLLNQHATVTICHSRTPDLAAITKSADLLIAATGAPGLIKAEHVKPGATVIDVGITRDPKTNKLTGDVERASVEPIAGALTPVPGGVGPMTIAMLLSNTLQAYRAHQHE
jgi:methylenetetrahydrofolate dehydrogenase (NADP+)/methenyltetrahydrofolate cyclohydrolase